MWRLLAVTYLAIVSAAGADDWKRFQNERYGYSVEIPGRFQMEDPDEDGWAFVAAGVRVLVFGADLIVTTFEGEASNKIGFAMDRGWDIKDSLVGQERMRFRGTKDGRTLEAYGIWLCNDAAAFINFEFDEAAAEKYGSLVERIKESLAPPAGCELQEGFYSSP